jgi:hypothetical protein
MYTYSMMSQAGKETGAQPYLNGRTIQILKPAFAPVLFLVNFFSLQLTLKQNKLECFSLYFFISRSQI